MTIDQFTHTEWAGAVVRARRSRSLAGRATRLLPGAASAERTSGEELPASAKTSEAEASASPESARRKSGARAFAMEDAQ